MLALHSSGWVWLVLLSSWLLAGCSTRRVPPRQGMTIDDIAEPVTVPGWLVFKPGAKVKVNPRSLFSDHPQIFHLPPGNGMNLYAEEADERRITHLRYRQAFRGVEVENAEFLVRAKGNVAQSANGRLAYDFQPQTTAPRVSEADAWGIVQRKIPVARYFREQGFVDDINRPASVPAYRPSGKLIFAEVPGSPARERRLCWQFSVYVMPFERSRRVYIDANDGSTLKEQPLFDACQIGSGPVTFRGTRTINTQQEGNRFRLRDDCDGNLLTANLEDAAKNVVDVSDEDNDWTGNNPSVLTSLWGLRASYDYFRLLHGRLSYDGKNGNVEIRNEPTKPVDSQIVNGQWASGGSGMIQIGLANLATDNDDYNALDIIGHEFTHSVIQTTAGLENTRGLESAALNESFADIFGQMVEYWIEGGVADWLIGEAQPDLSQPQEPSSRQHA
jgi:bacillolysin